MISIYCIRIKWKILEGTNLPVLTHHYTCGALVLPTKDRCFSSSPGLSGPGSKKRVWRRTDKKLSITVQLHWPEQYTKKDFQKWSGRKKEWRDDIRRGQKAAKDRNSTQKRISKTPFSPQLGEHARVSKTAHENKAHPKSTDPWAVSFGILFGLVSSVCLSNEPFHFFSKRGRHWPHWLTMACESFFAWLKLVQ